MTGPLADGCYRAEDGTPLLKVSGDEAEVLVAGDVRQVVLERADDWHGRGITVTPAFFLRPPQTSGAGHRGQWAVQAYRSLPSWRLELKAGEQDDVLLIPIFNRGKAEVRRGPC